MNKYFSKDIVNPGRQKELDIAKGLAIIFMVWEHILGKFNIATWGFSANLIVNFLAGPFAAPVFMFTMGLGITYSRRNESIDLLKRGRDLYLIGFTLNICRNLIPEILRAIITNTAFHTKIFYSLVSVDILQFAALSFLFLGLMRKWRIPDKLVMILVVLFSIVGSFTYLKIPNVLLANLVGHLVPTSGEVIFPFANWIVFPVAGYFFGRAYKHLKDKHSFYKRFTPILFGSACLYLAYGYKTSTLLFVTYNSYFFMKSYSAIFILSLVVGWFGVLYLLFNKIENPITNFLSQLSHNINSVYVLQWTIIGLTSALIRIKMNTLMVVLATILILGSSYLLSLLWSKYKKQKRQGRKNDIITVQ